MKSLSDVPVFNRDGAFLSRQLFGGSAGDASCVTVRFDITEPQLLKAKAPHQGCLSDKSRFWDDGSKGTGLIAPLMWWCWTHSPALSPWRLAGARGVVYTDTPQLPERLKSSHQRGTGGLACQTREDASSQRGEDDWHCKLQRRYNEATDPTKLKAMNQGYHGSVVVTVVNAASSDSVFRFKISNH